MAASEKRKGRAVDVTPRRVRFQPITTFEESAEAHKTISRLIFEGGLDDFGPTAEVEPIEFEVDEYGKRIAVVFLIRAPREFCDRVATGVSLHGGLRFQLAKPANNVLILNSRQAPDHSQESNKSSEMVEQKFSIAV